MIVERRIHVPAIEGRHTRCFISRQDGVLVEGGMGRVFEHCGPDAHMIIDSAVANELYLRNARDGLVVWSCGMGRHKK